MARYRAVSTECFSAWLLISELDRLVFSQSAGFSMAAQLDGRLEESTVVSGTLLAFPSLASAVRAALRMHPELARMMGNRVPPMAVDVGGNAKRMMTLIGQGSSNTILVSEEVAKILSGEPLELLPGPKLQMDRGKIEETRFVNLSALNMGWASPMLEINQNTPSAPYQRATASPVVHIHMEPKKKSRIRRIPWKWMFMMSFLCFSIFVLYGISRYMMRSLGTIVTQEHGQEYEEEIEQEVEPNLMTGEAEGGVVEVTTDTGAPPPPLGFGTIVVQTDPLDAKIYLDDELVGEISPLELEKKSNQEPYTLTVRAEGYESQTRMFNVQANERKVIDVKLSKLR